MKIEQKIKNFMSGRSIQRWKVWMIMTVMTTSLLLSSCDEKDYQTDLGDPSLYKKNYVEVQKENKSLRNSLDNQIEENARLRENYAALKQQKVKDITLLEREKALDEREKNISNREKQNERDLIKSDNARDEVFDNSIEIGKNIGQLEKDEEIITSL